MFGFGIVYRPGTIELEAHPAGEIKGLFDHEVIPQVSITYYRYHKCNHICTPNTDLGALLPDAVPGQMLLTTFLYAITLPLRATVWLLDKHRASVTDQRIEFIFNVSRAFTIYSNERNLPKVTYSLLGC